MTTTERLVLLVLLAGLYPPPPPAPSRGKYSLLEGNRPVPVCKEVCEMVWAMSATFRNHTLTLSILWGSGSETTPPHYPYVRVWFQNHSTWTIFIFTPHTASHPSPHLSHPFISHPPHLSISHIPHPSIPHIPPFLTPTPHLVLKLTNLDLGFLDLVVTTWNVSHWRIRSFLSSSFLCS